jgi:phage tail protein X
MKGTLSGNGAQLSPVEQAVRELQGELRQKRMVTRMGSALVEENNSPATSAPSSPLLARFGGITHEEEAIIPTKTTQEAGNDKVTEKAPDFAAINQSIATMSNVEEISAILQGHENLSVTHNGDETSEVLSGDVLGSIITDPAKVNIPREVLTKSIPDITKIPAFKKRALDLLSLDEKLIPTVTEIVDKEEASTEEDDNALATLFMQESEKRALESAAKEKTSKMPRVLRPFVRFVKDIVNESAALDAANAERTGINKPMKQAEVATAAAAKTEEAPAKDTVDENIGVMRPTVKRGAPRIKDVGEGVEEKKTALWSRVKRGLSIGSRLPGRRQPEAKTEPTLREEAFAAIERGTIQTAVERVPKIIEDITKATDARIKEAKEKASPEKLKLLTQIEKFGERFNEMALWKKVAGGAAIIGLGAVGGTATLGAIALSSVFQFASGAGLYSTLHKKLETYCKQVEEESGKASKWGGRVGEIAPLAVAFLGGAAVGWALNQLGAALGDFVRHFSSLHEQATSTLANTQQILTDASGAALPDTGTLPDVSQAATAPDVSHVVTTPDVSHAAPTPDVSVTTKALDVTQAAPTPDAAMAHAPTTHIVGKGETLWNIVREPFKNIQDVELRNLKISQYIAYLEQTGVVGHPNVVKEGMKLVLPDPSTIPEEALRAALRKVNPFR